MTAKNVLMRSYKDLRSGARASTCYASGYARIWSEK